MILVTGGTGLVGSHLLYFLLKDGASVRAIHRKSSNLEGVKKVFSYYSENPEVLFNQIDWVEANIKEIPALSEAFKGITHVYHAAAYISFNPKHYYKLKKANIEGTANIVNLCLSNSIEKLCYVSSVATLGKTLNGNSIDEESQWNPEENNSVYAITKFGAEMEVWRGTQEGLDVVIVNPGVILGEGFWDSGSGVIFKRAANGIPFYFGGGVGVVDVKDVVAIMLLLMTSDITNEKYILVGANVSYQQLLSQISIGLDETPPKKEAPKWVVSVLSALDGVSAFLFGTKRSLFKSTVRSLYTTSIYDSSKIRKELNYTFTPFEETADRVASCYSSEASSS